MKREGHNLQAATRGSRDTRGRKKTARDTQKVHGVTVSILLNYTETEGKGRMGKDFRLGAGDLMLELAFFVGGGSKSGGGTEGGGVKKKILGT